MLWFEAIAEQKIREAAERGEFAAFPGQGRPLDYLGDGLMVYFGWSRAHEDDAVRAIRAALLQHFARRSNLPTAGL